MKDKISKTQDRFWSKSNVEFDNIVMRVTENDKNIVADLQERLTKQKHMYEKKVVLFEAVQKNVAVLERMTIHSKKEMKLFRRQNVKLKETYDKNHAELEKLKVKHEEAMKELVFLREKDKAFNESDALREHLATRIAALETENERLSGQVDENEFQLRVLRKENE